MNRIFIHHPYATLGRTPFYAVSVNCLYRDRVRDRVSGRVTNRVRVRRPDSSGNLLTQRKNGVCPRLSSVRCPFM